MMLKFKSIFSIAIGVCMIAMWSLLLAAGQVAEISTEPYRIITHILSEIITAIMLIYGGIAIIKKKTHGIAINNIALGALLYSVLTAIGYYIQLQNFIMVCMFFVIIALTLICIFSSVINKKNAF